MLLGKEHFFEFRLYGIHKGTCYSREYTLGLSARFNSWLWSQIKRKVWDRLQAARERAKLDSELSDA